VRAKWVGMYIHTMKMFSIARYQLVELENREQTGKKTCIRNLWGGIRLLEKSLPKICENHSTLTCLKPLDNILADPDFLVII
jgi:hypothetical protein